MSAQMEFGLLGPLVVRAGGREVPVASARQRAVLAALLLRAGRAVSVGELARVLWGADPPESARVTVQNYVMRLRKALDGGLPEGGTRIRTRSGGYLILLRAGELDVSLFEGHLAAARAAARDGSWEAAAEGARAGLALWRGEPLADVGSELLEAEEVPRLAELRLQATETRIEADLHLGRHAEVITELRRLTPAHPLRERLHGLLMLALYRDGRQAEALAAFARARQVLIDELGLEPGAGLRELHARILAGDPALDRPAPQPAGAQPTASQPAVPQPTGAGTAPEGEPAAGAAAVNERAISDWRQGRYQQAAEKFLRARELFRQAGDRAGEFRALSSLGEISSDLERYQQAIGFLQDALSVCREAGDRDGEGITLGSLGFLMARQGRYQEATRTFRQALRIHLQTGNRRGECWTLIAFGEASLAHGHYQQAEDLLRPALTLSRAEGYRLFEAAALTKIGELARHEGRHQTASNHLHQGLGIYREFGDRFGEAAALNGLADVHLAAGQPREARGEYAAALGLAIEGNVKFEQARAHDGLGRASHALGDTGEARSHWQEALARYTDLGVPEAAQVRAWLDEVRPGGSPRDVTGQAGQQG